jgi:tetratricopeptide (TPR) repeat protein
MSGATQGAYLEGRQRLEAEDLGGAMTRWQEVAETAEVSSWMFFRMGEVQAEAKEWERAHSACRSALEAADGPEAQVAVWRAIGRAYEEQRRFDEAILAYRSAQEAGQRAWGEKSLSVATSFKDLGGVAYARRDLARTVEYYRDALKIEERLAPESLAVAGSLTQLGHVASPPSFFK